MSINCKQLRELIIRPTLKYLDLWSESAENLLLGTAAQESGLGTYIHQLGKGPALGIFQMEPNTEDDIWQHYLANKKDLQIKVQKLMTEPAVMGDQMIWNLYYATALARVHYLRVPKALPRADDIDGLAGYWKKYYNTILGAGTVEEFVANYKKYVTA